MDLAVIEESGLQNRSQKINSENEITSLDLRVYIGDQFTVFTSRSEIGGGGVTEWADIASGGSVWPVVGAGVISAVWIVVSAV